MIMERRLVSEEELIKILNRELAKEEDSEGYSFMEGITRLIDVEEDGCNWSDVAIRGSGVPVEFMTKRADIILEEVRKKYNLK
jgi:hypothetical protein